MDIATIIGLVTGVGLILYGMVDPATHSIPSTFFSSQGLAVVLGGTIAATAVNYPILSVIKMFRVAAKVFFRKDNKDIHDFIRELVEYGRIARKSGIAALEEKYDEMGNSFISVGFESAILEPDNVRLKNILNNEIEYKMRRHRSGQEMFYNMASYAPAFGLLGTVMGLILMMVQQGHGSVAATYALDDTTSMKQLLNGMGIALVTTFYGVLLANLFFLPIAGKLKNIMERELFYNEIAKTAILSIHRKEHPIMLEGRLLTFVDHRERIVHLDKSEEG